MKWCRVFSTVSNRNALKRFCADLHARKLLVGMHPDNLSVDNFASTSRLPNVVYAGFDPTSESLHIGHLVIFTSLFRAMQNGCNAIALVGTATAHIGDPSGHSIDRPIIETERLGKNAMEIKKQLHALHENFISLYGKQVGSMKFVDNSEWHQEISALEFLSICRDFRVGDMLRLGPIKSRMRSGMGISCTEFLYQVMQSYDWFRLSKDHDCFFQIGGHDQLGHLDAGCHYIQKKMGQYSAGICLPLLTDGSGQKLSKSSKNCSNIWINESKTSPYAFFQYIRQKSDKEIVPLMWYLSLRSVQEINDILSKHNANLGKWIAQQCLAEEMTTLVYGAKALDLAKRCSSILFEGSIDKLRKLSISVIEEQFGEASIQRLSRSGFAKMGELAEALCMEKQSAINLMRAGAFKLNNVRYTDPEQIVNYDDICLNNKQVTLVGWGKRKYHLVRWID